MTKKIDIPDHLASIVRNRSHAVMEELAPDSDEPSWTKVELLECVLDALDTIAQAEYDVLVRVWGEVAIKAALLPYCIDP